MQKNVYGSSTLDNFLHENIILFIFDKRIYRVHLKMGYLWTVSLIFT